MAERTDRILNPNASCSFRRRAAGGRLFVLVAFGLLVALVWLHLVLPRPWLQQAEANRIAMVPVPNRGLIVDRNGRVLATNYSAYTLEITPSKVEGDPR